MGQRYTYNPGEPIFDVRARRHINALGWCDDVDLDACFADYYQNNRWGSDETRSGTGSERSRMGQVIDALSGLVHDLRIQSVLDAPCGDFNWMRDVCLDEVDYLGYDIVEDLIDANTAAYTAPTRTFMKRDFTIDPVPKVDLIVCRDALVHFSYKRVFAALDNFRASGSKYLLTTTFSETEENTDIKTGWWRPVNLQAPPFSLPEPKEMLLDLTDDHYDDKFLALWDLQELSW